MGPPMDEASFRSYFAIYGNIVEVVLNQAKRFGFVSYSKPNEAQLAINGLKGVNIDGDISTFNIKLADKQGPPQSGSGPPGGSFMQQTAPPGYGNGFARSEPYGKGGPPMALAMYGHPKGNGKGSSLKDEFLLPNMPQRIAQAEPNSKLYVKNVPL